MIAPCRLEDPFYKYKATTELVCNMMNLRFGLHVPYYRFLQLLPGCNLSYSTLIGWAARAFEILAPLKPLLAGEITKEAKLVCMDETTFKLLDTPARIAAFKASHKSQRNLSIEGGRDSGSQASMDLEEDEDMEAEVATGVARRKVVLRGQMWTLLNPAAGLVMFEYSPSRATSNATAMLSGYKGLLMSDAYTAYKRLAKLSGNDITRLSCWVHARRKIVEAQDLKSRDPVAKEIIKRIGALYKIEKTIKGLAPRRKKKVRKRSTRLLKSLKKYMERKIVEYAPREAVRTAIQYCLNNWQELSQYPHHKNGIVDNNVTERAIRPLTVARKNILFLGSVDHAPGAALLYSLVECCKLQKIDPHAWLLDVMNRIEYYPKDQLTDLLPHKWKKVADNPKAQS